MGVEEWIFKYLKGFCINYSSLRYHSNLKKLKLEIIDDEFWMRCKKDIADFLSIRLIVKEKQLKIKGLAI